ncbi:MAG: methyltransferase domain-containing protein [Tatlockia sp.]|nr:methyltransferase domain-containing protein [Tatlockia sp.]
MVSYLIKGRDFNPKHYSNIANAVQVKDAEFLLSLYKFRGNERVLDIGSGDGQITARVALSMIPDGSIIGLDISQDMVQHASLAYPLSQYTNLSFIKGNVENLTEVINVLPTSNIALRDFDVIFSNHTLHWLYGDKAHENAVKQISLCLKQGGAVLLCFATNGNFRELFEAGFEVARSKKWSMYFKEEDLKTREFPSLTCYQHALEKNGFKTEIAEVKQNWRQFVTAEDFALWIKVSLRTLMSKLNELSDDHRMQFARQVVSLYLERVKSVNDYPNPDLNDGVYLRDVMIFIKALKM